MDNYTRAAAGGGGGGGGAQNQTECSAGDGCLVFADTFFYST